jgi:hypothetical protein
MSAKSIQKNHINSQNTAGVTCYPDIWSQKRHLVAKTDVWLSFRYWSRSNKIKLFIFIFSWFENKS